MTVEVDHDAARPLLDGRRAKVGEGGFASTPMSFFSSEEIEDHDPEAMTDDEVRAVLQQAEKEGRPATLGVPEGKPGRIVKVDDYTVNFEFDVPFYLFEELMMGDTLIGGGQAVRQSDKRSHGAYAPAHYLKQFLPKYAGGEDAANAAAKAAGYDNWVAYLHFAKDWTLNPEVPRMLSTVVLRALERRPEDRWQSALDLLRALETV